MFRNATACWMRESCGIRLGRLINSSRRSFTRIRGGSWSRQYSSIKPMVRSHCQLFSYLIITLLSLKSRTMGRYFWRIGLIPSGGFRSEVSEFHTVHLRDWRKLRNLWDFHDQYPWVFMFKRIPLHSCILGLFSYFLLWCSSCKETVESSNPDEPLNKLKWGLWQVKQHARWCGSFWSVGPVLRALVEQIQVKLLSWWIHWVCTRPGPGGSSKCQVRQLRCCPHTHTHTHCLQSLVCTGDYLTKNWVNATELYGISKYGQDSYRLFCRGEWREVQPTDIMLCLYRDWIWTNQKALKLQWALIWKRNLIQSVLC